MEAFVGTILMWPLNWAPVDWLPCDGRQLNSQQYAALYSLIGVTYGGNPANGTFNLPDLRGRVAVGFGGGAVNNSVPANIGAVVGAMNPAQDLPVTGTVQSAFQATASGQLTLNASNLPAHTHTVSGESIDINIPASTAPAGTPLTNVPTNAVLAQGVANTPVNNQAKIYTTQTPNTTLATFTAKTSDAATGSAGGGQPISLNLPVNGVMSSTVGATLSKSLISTVQPAQAINFIICVNGLYPQRP